MLPPSPALMHRQSYPALPITPLTTGHTTVTLSAHTGVPHICCTLQALKPANLQPGQRVLIHAGSGGVGSVAIQIAKAWGAYVVTTASGRNRQFLLVSYKSGNG